MCKQDQSKAKRTVYPRIVNFINNSKLAFQLEEWCELSNLPHPALSSSHTVAALRPWLLGESRAFAWAGAAGCCLFSVGRFGLFSLQPHCTYWANCINIMSLRPLCLSIYEDNWSRSSDITRSKRTVRRKDTAAVLYLLLLRKMEV